MSLGENSKMSVDKRKKQRQSNLKVNAIKSNRKANYERIPTIVGIGASAGGLEALEIFFSYMPIDSGMAFIVITHLDPSHHSMMPELIRNYTNMQVMFIKEGMKVQPNAVYFLPPNFNVEIHHGILHLLEVDTSVQTHFPINFFFESLAKSKRDKGLAVILSGTGSDGTTGIKAIKCEGGAIFVQDPITAKYDGMPQSAIKTGLADYVLPIEKIPEAILKTAQQEELKEVQITPELQQIFKILRTHTGHDFTSYKLNTIYRRIERQMHHHHVHSLSEYVKFLQIHPNEINALFKDFLIGVTRFFRDSEAFEVLK